MVGNRALRLFQCRPPPMAQTLHRWATHECLQPRFTHQVPFAPASGKAMGVYAATARLPAGQLVPTWPKSTQFPAASCDVPYGGSLR